MNGKVIMVTIRVKMEGCRCRNGGTNVWMLLNMRVLGESPTNMISNGVVYDDS